MPSNNPPSRLRAIRVVLWTLVALVAVSATVAYVWRTASAPTAGGEAVYAKSFQLVDHNGAAVTEAKFLGKPSAWFYGFTHCPDVCPTSLSELSAILQALGPDADKLNVVFVSIDPERDTPAIMKDYVEYFDPRITGLTGSLDAVSRMAKDRYIFFEKVPGEGDEYMMEHQASIQLVTAEGQFFGTLVSEESPEIRLAKVKRLIGAT